MSEMKGICDDRYRDCAGCNCLAGDGSICEADNNPDTCQEYDDK